MNLLCLVFVLMFTTGNCEKRKKNIVDVAKSKLMGVDTIRDIRLDKDTVITSNAIYPDKSSVRTGAPHTKDEINNDPDWLYSRIPDEVAPHVEQFKRNMTECLKEVQSSDKRPVQRLSPNRESPIHGECLIACVLKRNNVIENGKIKKENLLNLLSKFYAKETKVMKKLEKTIDRCIEIATNIGMQMRNECTIAARLNDCTNDLMSNNKHKIKVNY